MYGVLVVRWEGKLAYLAAFSGKLNGQWLHGKFVPPPFEIAKVNAVLDSADIKIKELQTQIREQNYEKNIERQVLKLRDLENQFHRAQNELIELHKERKNARHSIRAALANDTAPVTVEKGLAEQSQADRKQRKTLRRQFEEERANMDQHLIKLKNRKQALLENCRTISRQTQKNYFSLFRVLNHNGIPVDLNQLAEGELPPSGTGECAGAKLLAFANQHDLEPVAMAEFWWGQTTSGQVRHHGNFYPACRGKCGLLLPKMLPEGHLTEAPHRDVGSIESIDDLNQLIDIIYEDESLAIVDKPAGLLSVPGKQVLPSVQDWAGSRWPKATGPLLVHRLDMDTSGLLIIAKTAYAHRLIQKQFENRTIVKIYDAIVEEVSDRNGKRAGTINLPLRVDLDDRPRQIVCHKHGKLATTHWKITGQGIWSRDKGYVPALIDTHSANRAGISVNDVLLQSSWDSKALMRIEFKPATGRTHQLRVHAAASDGLNSPIVGDPLYGKTPTSREAAMTGHPQSGAGSPERMMLHARSLSLVHPLTGKVLTVVAQTPF